MARYARDKMPVEVKREDFELIRQGFAGAEAARRVGVSMSCGSLLFLDAGAVANIEREPISARFLSQDDRIEIADGLAASEPVKSIAAGIGKSFQSVYREIARNRKPDGSHQPWYTHNQAHRNRQRPKVRVLEWDPRLRQVVAGRLDPPAGVVDHDLHDRQTLEPEQPCGALLDLDQIPLRMRTLEQARDLTS